jgi:hypothetical protein
MSDFNDKPAPGADNPPVNYIPFKTLKDLKQSLEKLDFISRMNAELLKEILSQYGIDYIELDNGNIMLEKGALTASGVNPTALDCIAEILNHNKERIVECFKNLGVITTRKPFAGDETPAIYEGLIEALNNRNN